MQIKLLLTLCLVTANATAPGVRAADETPDAARSDKPHWTPLTDLPVPETPLRRWSRADRLPGMIGDFYGGPINRVSGRLQLDRLFVIADDLDAPAILPPSNSTLTITETGPVGVFSSSVTTVQQLQQILRMGGTPPPAMLAGQVADVATMTTQSTIGEIQAQLASTAEAFDVVLLDSPPGSYQTTVDGLFQGRNSTIGTTVFEQN